MEGLLAVLTWISTLGAALIAGTFFAFSTFIMSALARRPIPEGIAAMQSINVVVVQSPFIAVFVGTAATSAFLALMAIFKVDDPRAIWWLAGGALYVVGTFLLTIRRNVPLNDALAACDADRPESAVIWKRYLTEWTWWNHVRTAASLAATAAYILALR
ncbi:anthrone oxygenase family protein [Hyphomicrobium sp. LHD-15]|uniref:anthrone oxygenase family protein n=1 Tax=Hyphomicrobium sp. LHD-15 TaxID=3072142 RepID=UPI0028102CE5|nr:anthrone oxygenase family protein [Hyphomicrobium sp. LHD-15]MDQ8698716.1 DUF1772 domain-containing protein [Hyphomicrobium sp. LHD-15]